MHVEFITNASFLIELADGQRILTDPWLSPGIYYGSWYHFPPLSDEQVSRYLNCSPDWIYISHLHPDHLDPATLCRYGRDVPVLIGRLPYGHLRRAVAKTGMRQIFELELGVPTSIGAFSCAILGPFSGTSEGHVDDVGYVMDTALCLEDSDGVRLFNANDNPIHPSDVSGLVACYGRPSIAMLPYSGASFYPHAFRHYSDEEKRVRSSSLRQAMLRRFVGVAKELGADHVIPAAGSYVHGGKLAPYSAFLHQATPSQLSDCWLRADMVRSHLCLMSTGDVLDASGTIRRCTATRMREVTEEERLRYALELRNEPLLHETLNIPSGLSIPWERLMMQSETEPLDAPATTPDFS